MVDFNEMFRVALERRVKEYEAASPEERARIDARREARRVEAARTRVKVKATRTRIDTDGAEHPREVLVTLLIRPGGSVETERYLHCEDGPTGYESMDASHLGKAIERGGWSACGGTAGRWDRLFIPAESLAEARAALAKDLADSRVV